MALPGFIGSSSLYDKDIYHGKYHIAPPDHAIYPQPTQVYTYAKCIRKCYRANGRLYDLCMKKFWDYDDRMECQERIDLSLNSCLNSCDQGEVTPL